MNSQDKRAKKNIQWGHDFAGYNEQALAEAVTAAKEQLDGITYIPFPWSRFQKAQANGEQEVKEELEKSLQEIIDNTTNANDVHIITTYAGPHQDWASAQIFRCKVITDVFSCFKTRDLILPAGKHWHPIAMPCPNSKGDTSLEPSSYQRLRNIWKSVQAGEIPIESMDELELPGNADLWQLLFNNKNRNARKWQNLSRNAAELINEEHGGQRCVIQILRTLKGSGENAFKLDENNIKLKSGCNLVSTEKAKPEQITYDLGLKGSHRTPLAYREIAERCQQLHKVKKRASISITGNSKDWKRGVKSLCISEEPLWDLRACRGTYRQGETGYLDNFFEDLPIPYYLAVNPLIHDRIRIRLELLAATSTTDILERLLNAHVHYLGIHEFRLSKQISGHVQSEGIVKEDIRSLSQLRTKIGIHARVRGLGPSYGKGWGLRGFQGLRREAFEDWHLEKLKLIRTKSPLLGMAIENVHTNNYLTEKPFDMLCNGVVPITYASPEHTLHCYLDEKSHLNLYKYKIADALDAIEHFNVKEETAEAIHNSAHRLANLFGMKAVVENTLERIAERTETWILQQRENNTYRTKP